MDRKKTEKGRKKILAELIQASLPEDQDKIRNRDDQGLCLRKELIELERRAGL